MKRSEATSTEIEGQQEIGIVVPLIKWRQLRRIAAGYSYGTHRSAVVRAQIDKWMDEVLQWQHGEDDPSVKERE